MKEAEQIEAISNPASGRGSDNNGVLRMDDGRRYRLCTCNDRAVPVGVGDRGNVNRHMEDGKR